MSSEEALPYGEAFNIGSGVPISVREIAKKVYDLAVGYGIEKRYFEDCIEEDVDNRPGQVELHIASNKKIYDWIGWKPEVDFDTGLKMTFEWYKDNEWWWKHQFYNMEVEIVYKEKVISY
jgi:dTDP-glucose 4,6-dehydratase